MWMHPFTWTLLAAMLLLTIACFVLFRRKVLSTRHRLLVSSQTQPRVPGQSYLEGLDGLEQRIVKRILPLLCLPVLIYAVLVLLHSLARQGPSLALPVVGLAFIILIPALYLKLVPVFVDYGKARLRYAGEVAVAQALGRLKLEGYRVFHEVSVDQSTIAHLVVGADGIFAVETLARGLPRNSSADVPPIAKYDGRAIHFPDFTDAEVIQNAERNADSVSQWLSRLAGEPLAARAVVVVPGWVIKRTSSDGIPVVNPGQLSSLFEHIKPRPLGRGITDRLVGHLEQGAAGGQPEDRMKCSG
jgi:hypothetical protein